MKTSFLLYLFSMFCSLLAVFLAVSAAMTGRFEVATFFMSFAILLLIGGMRAESELKEQIAKERSKVREDNP